MSESHIPHLPNSMALFYPGVARPDLPGVTHSPNIVVSIITQLGGQR